jgi:release factor glutamine methyltransferase
LGELTVDSGEWRVDSDRPEAYRLGECHFYNIILKVTPDVLIPRPDSERLVDVALEYLNGKPHGVRLLDLCTGSGCIGLAVEANAPGVLVTYGDISLPALEVAKSNGCKDVRVLDALKPPPPELSGVFDILACNPPYVAPGDTALDKSVSDWEPHIALFGGADGLDFYRSLLPGWLGALKPGGLFIAETGFNQAETVARMMRVTGLEDVRVRKDYGGVERVVFGYTAYS